MFEKSTFDLKDSWRLFPKISKTALGEPKLHGIEAEFEALARGEEEFSIKHIEVLKDVNHKYWRFLDWWRMPEIEEKDICELGKYLKVPRPATEELVQRVCSILNNVEVCSCLLRFIDPINYGIISPPVENLLNIRGKTISEKYLNYLNALNKLRTEYHFTRNADVDMALWTLAHILNSPELRSGDEECRYIVNAFYAKPNLIKRIAAKNSLRQFMEEKEYLNIADMFVESDHAISAFIAGREIERWLRSLCKKYNVGTKCLDKKGNLRDCQVGEMLKKLENCLSREKLKKIRSWYRIRNDVVHDIRKVPINEVEDMIKGCREMKTWK